MHIRQFRFRIRESMGLIMRDASGRFAIKVKGDK